jgi:alcohol dehydrogenase class IV
MSHQITLPRILQAGAGASLNTAAVLKNLGCSAPLIITDAMMVQLGYATTLVGALAEKDIVADVFSDTIAEPTVSSIQAGVEKVSRNHYDCIIALGGGSAIDSAKAIAILGKFGGSIRDYKFPNIVNQPGLPIIAIPTTAGTGSEVTKVTIISDEENDEKMLCVGLGFMPIAALIDYELTMSVPARTTADTGIDALTHAMEAYVSKKASLYTDTQALSAMQLLSKNLRTVYQQGDNKPAREAMMLGSTLAGIAFSNASVALVHGMSRPIGVAFHVPHGLSNAMLLPSVTQFSLTGASARYAQCARTMAVASISDNDEIANKKLVDELLALNSELDVPSLAEFGIDKQHYFDLIPLMADQAIASGSPANNPRVPTREEIISLYQQLW